MRKSRKTKTISTIKRKIARDRKNGLYCWTPLRSKLFRYKSKHLAWVCYDEEVSKKHISMLTDDIDRMRERGGYFLEGAGEDIMRLADLLADLEELQIAGHGDLPVVIEHGNENIPCGSQKDIFEIILMEDSKGVNVQIDIRTDE